MMYYWPIFVVRNLIGLTKDSKSEAQSAHNALIESWKQAIQAAEKANEGGFWPIHVAGTLGFSV